MSLTYGVNTSINRNIYIYIVHIPVSLQPSGDLNHASFMIRKQDWWVIFPNLQHIIQGCHQPINQPTNHQEILEYWPEAIGQADLAASALLPYRRKFSKITRKRPYKISFGRGITVVLANSGRQGAGNHFLTIISFFRGSYRTERYFLFC